MCRSVLKRNFMVMMEFCLDGLSQRVYILFYYARKLRKKKCDTSTVPHPESHVLFKDMYTHTHINKSLLCLCPFIHHRLNCEKIKTYPYFSIYTLAVALFEVNLNDDNKKEKHKLLHYVSTQETYFKFHSQNFY